MNNDKRIIRMSHTWRKCERFCFLKLVCHAFLYFNTLTGKSYYLKLDFFLNIYILFFFTDLVIVDCISLRPLQ